MSLGSLNTYHFVSIPSEHWSHLCPVPAVFEARAQIVTDPPYNDGHEIPETSPVPQTMSMSGFTGSWRRTLWLTPRRQIPWWYVQACCLFSHRVQHYGFNVGSEELQMGQCWAVTWVPFPQPKWWHLCSINQQFISSIVKEFIPLSVLPGIVNSLVSLLIPYNHQIFGNPLVHNGHQVSRRLQMNGPEAIYTNVYTNHLALSSSDARSPLLCPNQNLSNTSNNTNTNASICQSTSGLSYWESDNSNGVTFLFHPLHERSPHILRIVAPFNNILPLLVELFL